MTEEQALQAAIDELHKHAYLAGFAARDWRTYGDKLQRNKLESRYAAEYCDRMHEAIAVLREILARYPSGEKR